MMTRVKSEIPPAALSLVVVIMIVTSSPLVSMFGNASASTPSDMFIVSSDSGAEVKTMELKAIKEDGEVRMVSDFTISTENVVSVDQNGKVTVFSAPTSPVFTSAKITDANDNTEDIPITDKGVVSLAGYGEGVYTLDVIVDDRFAFECILVIGEEQQQQQIINKQITEVNQRTDDPWKKGINKERVCLFTPSHPVCKPDESGKCPPRWAMNENGQCYPGYKKCPPGYWRADEDETGACVPLPKIPFLSLAINGTPGNNDTDSGIGNATEMVSSSDVPTINLTRSDASGTSGPDGGEVNQTLASEPSLECPEGEVLTSDGSSCEPIITEQSAPLICGQGEELADGQCQVVPSEEDRALDEAEGETEPQDDGVGVDGGDVVGNREAIDETGGDNGNEASSDRSFDANENGEVFE
jgi:hypothetical protein